MSLIVQKYGGTSVADPEKIKKVAEHIKKCVKKGLSLIVVVSARGKKTDELIDLAAQITANPDAREMDNFLQTGEVETAALLAMALIAKGVPAISLAAAQIGLVATGEYGKARIKTLKNQALIENQLKEGRVVIVAGFQGISENGLDIITLGRGGSDTTAVALAVFLGAEICEIYTDVDGVYTIDPRLVPNARRFSTISHDNMIALSAAGAGVLMDRAVIVARDHDVKIMVLLSPSIGKSTGGTLVTTTGNIADLENVVNSNGIVVNKGVSCINISNIPQEPRELARIFSHFQKINIIEAPLTIKGDIAQTSVLVKAEVAEKIFSELKAESLDVEIRRDIVVVTLVSQDAKETPGFISRITKAFGRNEINTVARGTGQNAIAVGIAKKDLEKAALALAEEFDLLSS